MDKFIVSARKYSPQNFSTVVGQSQHHDQLRNAIKTTSWLMPSCLRPRAWQNTCARILAKTINCTDLRRWEACNKCHSCVSFNEGTSLNIHELDAASNNSVDDIRSLVDQVRFATAGRQIQRYISWMRCYAQHSAFMPPENAEEPPSYAIFILATTEKHKILPTILSRCQLFDFKRITQHDTVDTAGDSR